MSKSTEHPTPSQAHQDASSPKQGGAASARGVLALLHREEIQQLVKRSDLRGFLSVLTTWGLIAASFALVAWWTHWLTILVALVILGGRHLGLAILMHDASHRSLFATRWLNDTIGMWLCAAPVWQRLDAYRTHHLAHHNHTGTEKDTDLSLSKPFPTTRASMMRKFLRDLLGISGLKRLYGLLLMDLGFIRYTASTDIEVLDQTHRTWKDRLRDMARYTGPMLLTNTALWAVLYAFGGGWLYLLWVVAHLTTFSLFVRIRSMAEHACTEATEDPMRNTRTTHAGWLARLTVAPHYVNYHLEHHLLMTVPHYNLPRLHRMLHQRGAFQQAPLAQNYLEVLQLVTSPQDLQPET